MPCPVRVNAATCYHPVTSTRDMSHSRANVTARGTAAHLTKYRWGVPHGIPRKRHRAATKITTPHAIQAAYPRKPKHKFTAAAPGPRHRRRQSLPTPLHAWSGMLSVCIRFDARNHACIIDPRNHAMHRRASVRLRLPKAGACMSPISTPVDTPHPLIQHKLPARPQLRVHWIGNAAPVILMAQRAIFSTQTGGGQGSAAPVNLTTVAYAGSAGILSPAFVPPLPIDPRLQRSSSTRLPLRTSLQTPDKIFGMP